MDFRALIRKLRPHISKYIWKLIPFTVDLEDAEKGKLRFFPLILRNKIHLFGAEHTHWIRIDFSSPKTLRFASVPSVKLTEGRPTVPPPENPAVVHIILCHLPPRDTERILRHAHELGNGYTILLAYGGPKELFASIDWPHKVFLNDPSYRGPLRTMSYYELISSTRDYIETNGLAADWIFTSDYDLLPTQPLYLDPIFQLMAENRAGMASKAFFDVSLSNCPYLLRHLQDGRIGPEFNGPGKLSVYQCLGCGLAYHRECFDQVFRKPGGLSGAFFEVALPTEASALGFRLLSLDAFGSSFKHVRFRPVYAVEDAIQAADESRMIHPIKKIDAFLDQWEARHQRELGAGNRRVAEQANHVL
jgi:hypothetical protein